MNLLSIKDLNTTVSNKSILNTLNININKGELHVIMGPNGAGKSTLANVLVGHPKYEVTSGEMLFEDESLIETKVSERAKKGIFLSFQHPQEIDGITVENFLRTAKNSVTNTNQSIVSFKKSLKSNMEMLNIDESYAKRYLNVGFSGGEKKKLEMLQMMTLQPKLVILDEMDSGLDVDAIKIVSDAINKFKTNENAFLIITHNPQLLNNLKPDFVHVLVKGTIVKTGDSSIITQISQNGFKEFV